MNVSLKGLFWTIVAFAVLIAGILISAVGFLTSLMDVTEASFIALAAVLLYWYFLLKADSESPNNLFTQ